MHALPNLKAIELGLPQGRPLDMFTLGVDSIDARLGGGLSRGALHEIYADAVEDSSVTAAFAILLSMRHCVVSKPVIWVREQQSVKRDGCLYASGLIELGFNPDNLVMVDVPDTRAALRAGADIIKCADVGAVMIEPWGKAPLVDLTASRRLAMAASRSGVLAIMLRVDAQPVPSAAQTRWQVAAAPSKSFADHAPGNPSFDITLLRHRGGIPGFTARLEWNRDNRRFERSATPLSGDISAAAALRTDQARAPGQRRAA